MCRYAAVELRGEPFVLRTQLGGVASLVAGANYRLCAKVRCEAGGAINNVVVGLGVAALPGMPSAGRPTRFVEGIWNYWQGTRSIHVFWYYEVEALTLHCCSISHHQRATTFIIPKLSLW